MSLDLDHIHRVGHESARIWPAMPALSPAIDHPCRRGHGRTQVRGEWVWCTRCNTQLYKANRPRRAAVQRIIAAMEAAG